MQQFKNTFLLVKRPPLTLPYGPQGCNNVSNEVRFNTEGAIVNRDPVCDTLRQSPP